MNTEQQDKPSLPYLIYDRFFKYFFAENKDILLCLLKVFLPLPDQQKVQNLIIMEDEEKAQRDRPERDSQTLVKEALAKVKEAKKIIFSKESDLLVQSPTESAKKLISPEQLTLEDSLLHSSLMEEKQVALDLNVSLSTGEKVDVEMQTTRKPAFTERAVFYWSRLHASSLKKGDNYDVLRPTYSLIFTNFGLPGIKRQVVNSFSIRADQYPHSKLNNQLGMVFVDLSCFEKDISQVLDKKDQWCYFIKNAGQMTGEEKKLLSGKGADMAKAVGLFDGVPASRLKRLREWSIDRYERDQRSLKDEVYDKGRQEGMQQVALSMLKEKADLSFICKVTGLSEKELKKLKNGS